MPNPNNITANAQLKGWLIVAFSAIITGTEAIFTKLSYAGGLDLYSVIIMKTGIALIGSLLVATLGKKPIFPSKQYLWPTMRSAFMYACVGIFLFQAYAYLPAGLAILFFYVSPTFTIICARLINGEAIRSSRVIAVTIAITGLILLFWTSVADISVLGVCCSLIAAVFAALYNIYLAKLMDQIAPETFACTQYMATIFFYLLLFLPMGRLQFHMAPAGIFWVSCLGVFATFLPMYMFYIGIRLIGGTKTSITYMLETPVTVILAYFVFGDTLTPIQLFGAACIVTAVGIPQLCDMLLFRRGQAVKSICLGEDA